jgi:hypothetical protein
MNEEKTGLWLRQTEHIRGHVVICDNILILAIECDGHEVDN